MEDNKNQEQNEEKTEEQKQNRQEQVKQGIPQPKRNKAREVVVYVCVGVAVVCVAALLVISLFFT